MDEFLKSINRTQPSRSLPTPFVDEEEEEQQPVEQEEFVTPFGGERFTIEEPVIPQEQMVQEAITEEPIPPKPELEGAIVTEETPTTEVTTEAATEETIQPISVEEARRRRQERALGALIPKTDEQTFYESYLGKTANIVDVSNLEADIEDSQKMSWLGKLATFEATGNIDSLKPDSTRDEEFASKGKNLVTAFANQRRAERTLEGMTESEVDQSTITQIPKMFAKSFGQSVNRSLAGLAGIAGDLTDGSEAMRNLEKEFSENAEAYDTIIKTDKDFNNSLLGQVTSGFGQLASTLAFALTPAGVATKVGAGVKGAQWIGQGVATLLGTGAEYNDAYEQAIESGMSEEEARSAAQKYAPAGVLDVAADLTVARFLKVPGFNKKALDKLAIALPGSALLEGGTEGLQKIYQNEILNKPWYEGAWDEALVGGIVGGGVNLASRAGEKANNFIEKKAIEEATARATARLDEVGASLSKDALAKTIDPTASITTPATQEVATIVEQKSVTPRETYLPGTFEETIVRNQATGINQATTDKLNKAVTNGATLTVGDRQVSIDNAGGIIDNDGNAITVNDLDTVGIKINPAPLKTEIVSDFDQRLSKAKTDQDLAELIFESEAASIVDPRYKPLVTKAKLENFDRLIKGVNKELTPVGYFDTRKSKSKFRKGKVFDVSEASKSLETSVNQNIESGGIAAYYVTEDDGTTTKYNVTGAKEGKIDIDGIGQVKASDIVRSKTAYIRSVAGAQTQTKGAPTTTTPALQNAINLVNDVKSGTFAADTNSIDRLNNVAKENGIEVVAGMTPDDIVSELNKVVTKAAIIPAQTAIPTGREVTPLPIKFEEISEGHKAFSQGLDKLVQDNAITPDGANLIKEIFRDTTPDVLLKASDIRTRENLRALGKYSKEVIQGKDKTPLRSWITLRKDLANETLIDPTNEPSLVFLHEYGHFAFDNVLNDTERQQVQDIYNKLKGEGKLVDYTKKGFAENDFNIKYLSKNPQEFMAQSFAEFVITQKNDNPTLQTILQKIYNSFKKALQRVAGRATTTEAQLLAPILEKMRIGREVAPAQPTATQPTTEQPVLREVAPGTYEYAGEIIEFEKADEKATSGTSVKDKVATFFKQTGLSEYAKRMEPRFLRFFGLGNRTPQLQRIIENIDAYTKRLAFQAKTISGRLKDAADKDNFNYNENKEQINKALITQAEGPSEVQLRDIEEISQTAGTNAGAKWLNNNLTQAERNNLEASNLEPSEWLTTNKSEEQARKYQYAIARAEKSARTLAVSEIRQANLNQSYQEAAAALNALPPNLKEEVLRARAELEAIYGKTIKGGVIPYGAKVTIGDKETDIEIAEMFWIQDNKAFADKIKQDPDKILALTRSMQSMYINNRIAEIKRENLQDGKLLTDDEARQIAEGEMSLAKAEEVAMSYINAAVNNPNKAFQNIIVPALKLTPDQALLGPAKILKDVVNKLSDPEIAYQQLVLNVAEQISFTQGFNRMKELGLAQGWIIDPAKGAVPEGYVLIDKSSIPALSRTFKGLYLDPIFVKEIQDTYQQQGDVGGFLRTMIGLNGMSMAAQTVFSAPRGYIRNFFGNSFIFFATGNYDLTQLGKELDVIASIVRQKGNPEVLNQINRLQELGVLDQNIDTNMIQNQIKIAKAGEAGILSKTLNTENSKKLLDWVSRAYNAGDNVWKLATFRLEEKTLNEAYKNGIPAEVAETQATLMPGTPEYKAKIEELAADRVKDSMVSFNRMNALGRLAKKPGYQSLMASFIGFTSEMIRIAHTNVRVAVRDINSGNDVLKRAGYRRLAGTVAAHSSIVALGFMLKDMFGIGEEEEEAARRTLAPWDKNATLLWWRDKDGNLNYFNTSFINPYSMVSADPIRAALTSWKDNDEKGVKALGKAMVSGLEQTFGGYVEPQIFTKAAAELAFNRKGDAQIYNPESSATEIASDISSHLGDVLLPATIRQAKGLARAIGGEPDKQGKVTAISPAIVNFLFARSATVNPETAFRSRMFELNRRLRDSAKILTSEVKTKGRIDDEDVIASWNNANDSRYKVMSDAAKFYRDGLTLGVDPKKLDEVMKEAVISAEDIRAIKRGYIKPYSVSKNTLSQIPPERAQLLRQVMSESEPRPFRESGELNDAVGLEQKKPSQLGRDFI